jgi:hypothetical protein
VLLLPDPGGRLPEAGCSAGRGAALTKRSLLITSLEQVRDLALCILIEVATVTGVPLIRNR